MRIVCLAALLLLPAFALAQPAHEAELRALEERLAQALIGRDEAVFDQLLAPDFVLRSAPDVSRATWIENARRLCWGDAYDISDFRIIRSDGRSALVALVLATNRDPETCEPAVVRSLLTDLWERRDGAWQIVLRHSGPVGPVTAQFAKGPVPPPRWERSAELSLVSTGGNTSTQTLGLGGAIVWRPGPLTTTAHVSFVRSETAGVETARTLVSQIRQARSITATLDVFGRLEYLSNEFAGIDDRLSVDAGVGWRLLEHAEQRLRLDAGLGYSHEARLSGEDLSFALVNLGSDYAWQISRVATLGDAALFTASLNDSEDWRFGNTVRFTTAMTRLLSLKLSHELKYANAPVPGFRKTDRILSAALVMRF